MRMRRDGLRRVALGPGLALGVGLGAAQGVAGDGVAASGPRFHEALAPLRDRRVVGDLRGRGFMAAVELVADRETKEPFERHRRIAERVTEAAFEAGLIVWPNVGHVDGERGDLVMLGPPFIATDDELDEIGRRLGDALDVVERAPAGEPS